LFALSAATGTKLWHIDLKEYSGCNPLIGDGSVIMTSVDGIITSFNIASGQVNWKHTAINRLMNYASPIFSGTDLITSGADSSVHCIDTTSGMEKWSYHFDNELQTSPTISDSILFAGGISCVYALDLRSKQLLWKKQFSSYVSAPIACDHTLYITVANDRNVYAIDPFTGLNKWQITLKGGMGWAPLVVDQNGVPHYPAESGNQN
jgi:outer membrane protein assembly factor BamB